MAPATAHDLPGDAAPVVESERPGPRTRRVDAVLLHELVSQHHRFIWRLLGRIGIQEADLDDATQQVFLVLVQRPDLEIVVGSERSFLFGVALRVAHTHRRTLGRRREVVTESEEPRDRAPLPDDLADQQRARRLLDGILAEMPAELRLPFVLFEIEDLTTPEIATLLELPTGTVASRLRRAREWFERRVRKLEAQRRLLRGER